ncbi:hypothetical protein LTR98_011463 [Exophiala xenobiotica]|nr:hypothetical protein LTR98_011463 [Exophiala xenobiotica]
MSTTRNQQYKEDSNFVRVSLTETAKQYGYFDTHTSKKYTISSRDYISLAKHISKHETSVSYLPIDFFLRLQRTITLRRQQHVIHTRRGTEDEGHLRFIDILEGVQSTLAMQERLPWGSGKAAKATTDPLAQEFSGQGVSSSPKHREREAQIRFEPRDDDMQDNEEEKLLALTWLVDDLHEIKGYAVQLWSQYRTQELDLITTSLGTNAAIEWAREIQSEYSEVLGDATNISRLQEALWMMGNYLTAFMNFRNIFFWSIRLLLEAYLNIRSPGTLSCFKPNYYGSRDVFITSRKPFKRHQKFHVDKALLLEILPHFDVVARMDGVHPYQDAIVAGLGNMFQDEQVPLWLAFSLQVFLDIQYELGTQVGQGYLELIDNANALERSLKATLSSLKANPLSQWLENGMKAMETLGAELRTLQSTDLTREFVSSCSVESPEGTVFGSAEHELLKVHPLTCGLWLYSIRARYHDLGVRLANADETIVGCAHAYNALKREGILRETWLDMELLLQIQEAEDVFAGQIPQAPSQYMTQFRVTLDQIFRQQVVHNLWRHENRRARDCLPLKFGATATRLFMNQYVIYPGTCSILTIREALQSLKTGGDWVHTLPESESKSPFGQRLHDLCGMVRREGIEFYFDYFQFRQFCWLVTLSITQAMQAVQGPDGAKAGSQNDAQYASVVMMLFKYLINSCDVVGKGLKPGGLEVRGCFQQSRAERRSTP